MTLRLLERYNEALATYEQALTIDPGEKTALANKGKTLGLMERFGEAIMAFDKALEIDPKYDWAWGTKGETLCRMGRYAEALTSLNQAIECNLEEDWRYYVRGLAYSGLGQKEKATDDYQTAIQKAQERLAKRLTDGRIQLNLGLYLLVMGDITNSMDAYQKGVKMSPTAGLLREAIRDLTNLRKQLGELPDTSKAIELLQDALSSQEKSNIAAHS